MAGLRYHGRKSCSVQECRLLCYEPLLAPSSLACQLCLVASKRQRGWTYKNGFMTDNTWMLLDWQSLRRWCLIFVWVSNGRHTPAAHTHGDRA